MDSSSKKQDFSSLISDWVRFDKKIPVYTPDKEVTPETFSFPTKIQSTTENDYIKTDYIYNHPKFNDVIKNEPDRFTLMNIKSIMIKTGVVSDSTHYKEIGVRYSSYGKNILKEYFSCSSIVDHLTPSDLYVGEVRPGIPSISSSVCPGPVAWRGTLGENEDIMDYLNPKSSTINTNIFFYVREYGFISLDLIFYKKLPSWGICIVIGDQLLINMVGLMKDSQFIYGMHKMFMGTDEIDD